MKNIILILALSIIYLNNITAQVLYTENFNNLTLGNLGTDVTGQTPGQGDWYTTRGTNDQYAIITEPNKGKVLSMFIDNPQKERWIFAHKRNLNTLIDQRAAGNNVIKIEFDFNPGSLNIAKNTSNRFGVSFLFAPPPQNLLDPFPTLMTCSFGYNDNRLTIFGFDGNTIKGLKDHVSLADDTWYQLVFYMDYTNKKCYFEMLGTNITGNSDFLTYVNPADFKLSAISLSVQFTDLEGAIKRENRFDNFKITALKAVPPHLLSTDNFLAQKFNLYPNPATNIVNITNSENRLVNQVEIYDVTGKLINTQNFNNEVEIQLNVENLASGAYMLHLNTNDGLVVKKLIKK